MTEARPASAVDTRLDSDRPGRVAQRRRTRRAIIDATIPLLAGGRTPSINEIAAAADVSRRTVYLHFPTLEQLILDATIGAINTDVDAVLDNLQSDDPCERLTVLIEALTQNMTESLPLGRRLIRLTVDAPPENAPSPRRGYRRIGWIETALEPLRDRLTPTAFEELVSRMAMIIGWESFIVLIDVRGLDERAAGQLILGTALDMLRTALQPGSPAPSRARP